MKTSGLQIVKTADQRGRRQHAAAKISRSAAPKPITKEPNILRNLSSYLDEHKLYLLQAGKPAGRDAGRNRIQAQLRVRQPARLLGRLLPRQVQDRARDAKILQPVSAEQALRTSGYAILKNDLQCRARSFRFPRNKCPLRVAICGKVRFCAVQALSSNRQSCR